MISITNAETALCLFHLPHQVGAAFFEGKDVTDFVTKWEDVTLDWSPDQRIKKVLLYSEKLISRYLKTWPTYMGGDWDDFKEALLDEFKDNDEEQKRNTEAYIHCLVQDLRKEKNPMAGRCRAFILEFTERADQLVDKVMINQHNRVFLFLQAFSDKVGDKLCKGCKTTSRTP